MIFYILTIAGLFRLRTTMPDIERPYRAFGYPIVPALYIVGAAGVLLVLFTYQTATTWPGLVIILAGVPFYLFWTRTGHARARYSPSISFYAVAAAIALLAGFFAMS